MAERSWSEQQKAIFNFFRQGRGNAVVRARAGTGKTTTIIEAISYAPEDKILLAAFNKRIQEELAGKIKNPKARAKTLHALGCSAILRTWGQGVKLDNNRGYNLATAVAGKDAPAEIVGMIKKIATYGKNIAPCGTPQDLIEIACAYDTVPDEKMEEDGWTMERVADLAHQSMKLAAKNDGTMDFDDMLYIPVVNRMIRPYFGLVVVDEAQDMNFTQLLLAQMLVRRDGRVVVVGDDRQAIYGFRGADSNSLDRLKMQLRAVEFPLTVTYRCPKKVVARAQKLVPDYMAAPSAPDGIIREIKEIQLAADITPGSFVLSRKNAPLVSICIRLLKAGKRAKIEGRDIGKSLLNIIKKLAGGDSIDNFLDKLDAWEEHEIERIKQKSKDPKTAIERIEDQAEMLYALTEGAATMKEVEERIRNLFDDAAENAPEFIVCSSVHKAKGLERDRVYMLQSTFYPGGFKGIEEQNIEYVAITRAKAELITVL